MVLWTLLAIVIVLVYFLHQYLSNYWTRRNFTQKQPTLLVGNIGKILRGNTVLGDFFCEIYNEFKQHAVVGVYYFYRPALVINDPKIVHDVMIKEFNSFHDRGVFHDEELDPLPANLFSLDGQKWRDLRVKLSPVFTSGKLKGMFPTIRNCAKVLENYLDKNIQSGDDKFDMRDLMARFTTNVISTVAFGIDNDCINDRDNIFRKMGLKIFESDFKQGLIFLLSFIYPSILSTFRVKVSYDEVEEFFMTIVKQTIDYRENSKENERKDFMQLMIQLKNQGYLSADKDDDEEDESDVIKSSNKEKDVQKLTFIQIVAQSFLFFVAGFETSSSTTNFTLFEITRNPEVQKKVHDEIDQVLKSREVDDITYEMLDEFKYLDCCIDEALRIYPIVPLLNRECTKDYKIPDTNLTIEKGTPIIIPVLGLHRDPNIYDNPMEFIPERFLDSPHGGGKVDGLFYSPFGNGPHNCIVSY